MMINKHVLQQLGFLHEEVIDMGENPRLQAGDHINFSHTPTADPKDRTRVAAVRYKCINSLRYSDTLKILRKILNFYVIQ